MALWVGEGNRFCFQLIEVISLYFSTGNDWKLLTQKQSQEESAYALPVVAKMKAEDTLFEIIHLISFNATANPIEAERRPSSNVKRG